MQVLRPLVVLVAHIALLPGAGYAQDRPAAPRIDFISKGELDRQGRQFYTMEYSIDVGSTPKCRPDRHRTVQVEVDRDGKFTYEDVIFDDPTLNEGHRVVDPGDDWVQKHRFEICGEASCKDDGLYLREEWFEGRPLYVYMTIWREPGGATWESCADSDVSNVVVLLSPSDGPIPLTCNATTQNQCLLATAGSSSLRQSADDGGRAWTAIRSVRNSRKSSTRSSTT